MALEESSDAGKDLVEEHGDLRFVIERADAEAAGSLTIDYLQDTTGEGFVIRPDRAVEGSCGSCSGSCGG